MKLIVFADGEVGHQVCEVLRDRAVVPSFLVIHDDAPDSLAAILPAAEVILWSSLQQDAVIERLQQEELDLGVLAWWPHIVRPELVALCGRGFLNLHPSLLPNGRGKDPNFWAIVDCTPFGVSIHHVTQAVDGGDIAFQRELEVTWLDDGESLYRRAQHEIVDLFAGSLDRIVAGDVPAVAQGDGGAAHRRSQLDDVARIDLDAPGTARRLLDVIRARTFPGHPAAWFEDGGIRYEVRIKIERSDSSVDD